VIDSTRNRRLCLTLLVAATAGACGEGYSGPEPAALTLADFQSLGWLEGAWEGSGGQFFEEYVAEGDGTLAITYYGDAQGTEVRGTGRVYYAGGRIFHETDGAVWVVTAFDSTGVYFGPVSSATNTFRWTRLSDDSWEAVLQFADGSEARYELSRMER